MKANQMLEVEAYIVITLSFSIYEAMVLDLGNADGLRCTQSMLCFPPLLKTCVVKYPVSTCMFTLNPAITKSHMCKSSARLHLTG